MVDTKGASNARAAIAGRTKPEKIGLALSAVLVLFLLADAIPKIFGAQFARTATEAIGFPPYQTYVIGWVLLACVIAWVVPRTAVLGAVGLTAYLGGAVTVDMHQEAWFPVVFAVAFGLLIWAALILRRPALLKVLISGTE
ncbi:DoxX family protein [Mycolicibacterium sp. HS_4_1]